MTFQPPPSGNILQAMAASLAMGGGMAPQQYHQMAPMAGLIQMPIGMAPPSMGVTVPSGVTTISAPPVRKITTDQPPPPGPALLGMYPGAQPMFPGLPQDQNRKPKPPPGSTITIFVGNITDRASDMLIRQLLSKCGSVNNWKRVQGANGKLQAFGFCEYCDPESAMRAIRLLKDFEIADKKLVVNLDAKTQEKLDEYNRAKGVSSGEIDDQTRNEDQIFLQQLQAVLKEHEIELSRDPDPKERIRIFHKKDGNKMENISDMEMEEDKRSLINREIDKFRDTYKRVEEKKEEEKKRKDEQEKGKGEEKTADRRSRDGRERSDERDRGKSRNFRMRDRSSDREKRRDRDRDRDRERDRDRDRWSESRDERADDEEEAYERRRVERQLRDKEASYQKRLQDWESRERRKLKEYEKERSKEEKIQQEEEIESKRLKEFLEDYDDDRFDAKYYKGNAYSRRWRERQKEVEADKRERDLERKELEELKEKLAQEGHPDPDSEAKKLLLTGDSDKEKKLVNDKIHALMTEARQGTSNLRAEDDLSLASSEATPNEEVHVKKFGFTGMKLGGAADKQQISLSSTASPESANGISVAGGDVKRKKFLVSDVFNPNDDDDASSKSKKRKLPTLIDDNTDSNLSTPSNPRTAGEAKSLTSEEKRKQAKAIIEKIPTSKEELFKYSIEWSLVDNNLMERRIRPWINKKIAEYIGEEEQALLDFICTKLSTKSSAQSILDDVAMVLDEEAEVFVVKMWRLLIYEIEAKKIGIGK